MQATERAYSNLKFKMQRQKILVICIFFAPFVTSTDENSFLAKAENNYLDKFWGFTNSVAEYLEDFNDNHLGKSEWGRLLGYEDMKPKISDDKTSRGIKKMSMAMMPLVFHVGATSTWMILTSIMAAKSVAIGLLLLVFKIAVSSAKVASFFTLLKSKSADHHHEYSWAPHGHESVRSLSHKEIPVHSDWNSYTPEWSSSDPHTGYKTIPVYKENQISNYEDIEYEEPKTHLEKKNG